MFSKEIVPLQCCLVAAGCQLFFWGSCLVWVQSEIPHSASLESFTEIANSDLCVFHRPTPLFFIFQCACKMLGEFDEVPILTW